MHVGGGKSAGADCKATMVANKADDGDETLIPDVVVASAGKKHQPVDNAVPYEMVDLTATRVSH